MKRRKPVVGEELWLVKKTYCHNETPRAFPCKVVSVGKKYFRVSTKSRYHEDIQFHIDSWIENNKSNYHDIIFESKQEHDDIIEYENLIHDIRDYFGSYGKIDLPLEDLRKIKQIIWSDK